MASQLPLVPLTFALFVLFINWINIFQFWFLDCPFLFLSVLSGFPILIQATGHMWSGRDVVWIFVSLPPDHICPLGRNSFKDANLVKPVHESNRFLFPSSFQQSSIRFVCCNVQIGLRWPDEINFLQWNWEWHEKLNSWFNMTTIKWNLLNRPEVFPRHLLFLQVESLHVALRFSAEILSLLAVGSRLSVSGFLEFVVSTWQFCWTICNKKCKFSNFFGLSKQLLHSVF